MPDRTQPTADRPTLPEPAPSPPPGYLDAVGGQPLLPIAVRAYGAAADLAWSDPARLHHAGRRAAMVLEAARASIAQSLSVRPDDVFFSSSGPTALAVAVQGLLDRRAPADRRAVVSAVESMAVLSAVQRWARDVDQAPVDDVGRIDLEAFAELLVRPAALACVQAANGELGTRQPLAAVAEITHGAGVPLLVHAIQVIGHEPVPDAWDVLAASARDWGGPAGVGILVIRPDVRWAPDENPDRGWVGGFPDVAGAAAAASALEYLRGIEQSESTRLRLLVERVREELPRRAPGVRAVGDPVDRLPHIVTFVCDGVIGEALVTELDRRGVMIASGSACTSDARMPSQVLEAIGQRADASVRVSLPFGCTDESVDRLIAEFRSAVEVIRG